MDNFLDKGLVFPEKEWWDERKTDVSFLYAVDSEGEASVANTGETEPEFSLDEPLDLNVWRENLAGESGETKISKTSATSVALDEWVKEIQNEEKIKPTITSLAGYINIAYPIIKSLKPTSPNPDANLKETGRQLRAIAANLRTVAETVDAVQSAIAGSRLSDEDADAVRAAVRAKSKAILEKCELANVLTNLAKSVSRIRDTSSESASRTFGSSVDLL